MKVWTCSIGPARASEVPFDGDLPMRLAVQRAYKELTGRDAEFTFSGWGGEFSQAEQEYIAAHKSE